MVDVDGSLGEGVSQDRDRLELLHVKNILKGWNFWGGGEGRG